VTARM